jgi:hypothetical protein
MGARLRFAKVIDRQLFYVRNDGRLHPGLDNEVLMHEEPGVAGAFLVMRGWGDDHGSFTEKWRIESPDGRTLYESLPREIHVATTEHVERLEDEIADLEFEFTADNYQCIFDLDDSEVARIRFAVKVESGR